MDFLLLFKSVEFNQVFKELVITNSEWKDKSSVLKTWFEQIQEKSLIIHITQYVQFAVNQDTYDTLLWIPNQESAKLPITYNEFLNSTVKSSDLTTLSKELIVACAINYLTFEGTVFNELEYKEKLNHFQQLLTETKNEDLN